jgi:murein DD-endopeptidase MepM/ murein hydrolase activator NlpD
MTDTIDVELGSVLSKSSGFGLSDMLIQAFDRQAAGRAPAGLRTPPPSAVPSLPAIGAAATAAQPNEPLGVVPASVSPATGVLSPRSSSTPLDQQDEASASTVGPVMPEGRVSSGFGWRSDPFNGQVRFHSGTDVKMAYGQDVQSAADGRVSFVGEQSGYGLVVTIDHGNGVETRYGHLSQTAVRPGDQVTSGQVVARSGNSGRSTGPHLHFEVLDHGRAVAPETMGQLLH